MASSRKHKKEIKRVPVDENEPLDDVEVEIVEPEKEPETIQGIPIDELEPDYIPGSEKEKKTEESGASEEVEAIIEETLNTPEIPAKGEAEEEEKDLIDYILEHGESEEEEEELDFIDIIDEEVEEEDLEEDY
jgi:hypothetical protein